MIGVGYGKHRGARPFWGNAFGNGLPVPQIASAAAPVSDTYDTPSTIGDMCTSVIGYGLHGAGTVH